MKRTFLLLVCVSLGLSGSARAADYFPLEVGNVWEHDVMTPNPANGELQDFGTATWTITGDTVIGETTYFVVEVHGKYYFGMLDTTTTIFILDEGNDVSMTTDPESPAELMKIGQHTYTGDETWTAWGDTLQVTPCPTYSVPAGQFTSCFCVSADGDTASVYAPDVGPLRIKVPFAGLDLHFFLKRFTPGSSAIYRPMRQHRLAANEGLFTADNKSGTVTFDLGDRQEAVLSVFRPDGRLVEKYEIAGMGTIRVDSGAASSGNVLLRLHLGGKVYTGKMPLAK